MNQLPDVGLPMARLSEANEDHAFRLIATTLEARLADFPTTYEEDEYMLEQQQGRQRRTDAPDNRAAAAAASLLEKRLVAEALATLQAEVHQLRDERARRRSEGEQGSALHTSSSSAKRKRKKRGNGNRANAREEL